MYQRIMTSRSIMFPEELDLVLQIESAGVYTLPPFRQIEDCSVEVQTRSLRKLYRILRQGSLVSGI